MGTRFQCLILTLASGILQLQAINHKNLNSQKGTLNFTENKGQFADQNNNPRTDVLYGGWDGKLAFHITNKGISYQLYRVDSYKELKDQKTGEKRRHPSKQTIYRTDIKWLNANSDFLMVPDGALPGYCNYYMEQCPEGALNVKSYAGINLKNIYEGIDLHYYEKDGHLKYDFIVAPHQDYKQIQLKVEGASLKLQSDGSILIKTPLGNIQEKPPAVYQNGLQLKARYTIESNIIGFEIENYDRNFSVTIDPMTLFWGTYYGSTESEEGFGCTTDFNNNVYMVGYTHTNTGTIIATTGSHQNILTGVASDAFLVKFNSSGVRQYGTYYGGSGTEFGQACATDALGNVYMVGYTGSAGSGVIATPGSHQNNYAGGSYDAFLVKFNSSGIRQFGTYFGGVSEDYGLACAVDNNGNIFMSGNTSSSTGAGIVTTGCHQSVYGGGMYDAFLVKFSSTGVRSWGTYYGGVDLEYNYSCSVDFSGDVYMCGFTKSHSGTVIATSGSHQSSSGGGPTEAFLVKFTGSGVRSWATYYGGSANERAHSCTTDNFGNVYLTGYTNSGSGTEIATPGSHQSSLGQTWNQDAFLAKFNSSGQRLWGTYYGELGNDIGFSCKTDALGNVYLAGYTTSNSSGTIIATPGSHQTSHAGGSFDGFLAKFTANGVRLWGTYYGGPGIDHIFSFALDGIGNEYFCGTTGNSFTGIASPGSHQPAFAGQWDAFLVTVTDCTPLSPPAIFGPTVVCSSSIEQYSVTIDSTVNLYNWILPSGWIGSSTDHTINLSPNSAGVITLTAKGICGTSPQGTLSISVVPTPTVSVNSGSICVGEIFTISPTNAVTYSVSGGSFTVSPVVSSSYSVTGTDAAGCVSGVAVSEVTVHSRPTLSVNSGSICSGSNFTILPSGANTYTISGGSDVVSPATTSSYTVTGTSTEGCESTAVVVSDVTVHPSPTVGVSDWTICTGEEIAILPTGASSYFISGGNFTVNPLTTTVYSVSGVSQQGCISSEVVATVVVSECLGVDQFSEIDGVAIKVYPNPTNGILKVESEKNARVILTDMRGRIVYSNAIVRGESRLSISHLEKGIYSLEVFHSHGKKVFLIILD